MNYVKVPNQFIDNEFKKLTPTAVIVYLCLMYFVNERFGGKSFPSYRNMMEITGLKREDIKKAIETELSEGRIPLILERKREGRKYTNNLLYKPFEHSRNFTLVPIEILSDKEIGESAKKQYIYLLRLFGKGNLVFQTEERIAESVGISEGMVGENIRRLTEKQYLQVLTREFINGGQVRINKLFVPRKLVKGVNYNIPKAAGE